MLKIPQNSATNPKLKKLTNIKAGIVQEKLGILDHI
jgi:hypothetical protein